MDSYQSRALSLLACAFLAGMAIERVIQNHRREQARRDQVINHLAGHVSDLLGESAERRMRELEAEKPAPA
ncbi:hypothetical protein [Archangium violaceum]|uniref:hypothetical protein n=1 Tax=Archangium violaceum TaxID=83451 RepID=UPI0036DA0961